MKNRFDDILKRRWEQIQFPVEDTHRNEMIQLLNRNKRRKTGFIWWGSGVVLLLAISGILWFHDSDKAVKDNVQPENSRTSSEINNDRASETKKGTEIILKPSTGNQQKGNSFENNTSSLAYLNRSTVKEKKVELDQGIQVYSQAKSREDASKLPLETIKEDRQTPNKNVMLPDSEVDSKAMLSPELSNDGEQNNTNSNNNTIPLAGNTSIALYTNERIAGISPSIESIAISFIESPIEGIASPIAPVVKLTHPFHLFVETGIGYIPSSLPDYKAGWNVKAGGGVGYRLFSKTELFASAGYILQKGGFAFQRTSTVNQPGFGARSNFHFLTPDRLHSVYTRAGLLQRLRRHMLSASGGMQWIYGAQGTIVINTVDQFAVGPNESKQYGWLKLDGMQRILWNAEVNYGYQLTSRLLLQSGIKYNFSGLTVVDPELAQDYYWRGRFASFNPSFTINYRLYGK